MAVAQQLLEARGVLGGGDDEDVADAGQHEGAERVVDHRFVVDRDELLGDGEGGRVQPGAGSAGEDDAFALHGGGLCRLLNVGAAAAAVGATSVARGGEGRIYPGFTGGGRQN